MWSKSPRSCKPFLQQRNFFLRVLDLVHLCPTLSKCKNHLHVLVLVHSTISTRVCQRENSRKVDQLILGPCLLGLGKFLFCQRQCCFGRLDSYQCPALYSKKSHAKRIENDQIPVFWLGFAAHNSKLAVSLPALIILERCHMKISRNILLFSWAASSTTVWKPLISVGLLFRELFIHLFPKTFLWLCFCDLTLLERRTADQRNVWRGRLTNPSKRNHVNIEWRSASGQISLKIIQNPQMSPEIVLLRLSWILLQLVSGLPPSACPEGSLSVSALSGLSKIQTQDIRWRTVSGLHGTASKLEGPRQTSAVRRTQVLRARKHVTPFGFFWSCFCTCTTGVSSFSVISFY